MKLLLALISGCIFVGALLSLAPDFVLPSARHPLTAPATPPARATTTPELYYARSLRGVPVRTSDGIPLGVINDLVFDPTDAHILMVIVASGGRFGLGGRFMALPWGLVQPMVDGAALVVPLAPAALDFPPHEEGVERASPTTRRP